MRKTLLLLASVSARYGGHEKPVYLQAGMSQLLLKLTLAS